jgi:alternate signal-mediated exported protein
MKRSKRFIHLLKQNLTKNHKLFLFIATLFFSSLMVLGNTYAWLTAEDDKENHFEGGILSVEIIEDFGQVNQWRPARTEKKLVKAKNIGSVPSFVRLSFYEYVALFKIDTTDQTGNGHLLTVPTEQAPTLIYENKETWKAAATANGTYDADGTFYVVKDAYISDKTTGTDMFKMNDSQRENSLLKWFKLNVSENVYLSKPAAGTKDYWLYKDGYFYYSEALESGQTTSAVLNDVTLSASAPNSYKGSLYEIDVELDAHDTTKAMLSAWNISDTDEIYEMYKDSFKK